MVPFNASRSRGAGGTGPGAARGGPGEVRLIRRRSRNRESQRRSTVAPFMQLAVSASSAVPAAPPLQQRSPSEAVRLPSTRTTQLALLQSAPSTVICLRSACCLKLLHANALFRCSHPRCPSIPAPASHSAPAKTAEPAILTPAVPAPQRGRKPADCARKTAPRIACSRTSTLRVSFAGAAAVAAPPHACSDCAYLPVVPDKPRLYTLVVGPLTSECNGVRCMHAAAIQLPLPFQLS